jgi:hypothetical protein
MKTPLPRLLLATSVLTLLPALSAQIAVWNFDDAGSPNTAANTGSGGSTLNLRTNVSVTNTTNTQVNLQSTNTPGGTGFSLNLTSTGSTGGAFGANAAINGTSNSLSGLTAMTVSGWFNTSAAPVSGTYLIRASSNTNQGWQLTFNAAQQLRLTVGDGTASTNYNSAATAYSASTDTWQFFSVSWTSTGGATWYAGSPSVAATAAGVSPGARTMNLDASQVILGRRTSATGSFYGYLDDIRVYDTALNLVQTEAVRAEAIPEPSATAALFGVFALGAHAIRRRRTLATPAVRA